MSEPTDLQGQQEAQAAQLSRDKQAAHREVEDFRWVASTPQGRRFLWRELAAAGVYRSVFSSDALLMARLEGQRIAGLALLAKLMEHAPQAYALMTEENANA